MIGFAIVLDCDFPRIHRRTSFGIGLSKGQQQDRRVLLNTWFGHLLQEFHRFTPEAQEKVADFLGLTFRDIHHTVTECDSLLYSNLSDPVDYSKVFLLM